MIHSMQYPMTRLVPIAALLLLMSAPACGQEEAPDGPAVPLALPTETPAAQQLDALVETLRTRDASAIEPFIRDHMAGFLQEIPMNEHVSQLKAFYPGAVHLTFDAFVRNEPYAVEARFHNVETGDRVRIALEVEEAPPHRIYLIGLEPDDAPPGAE